MLLYLDEIKLIMIIIIIIINKKKKQIKKTKQKKKKKKKKKKRKRKILAKGISFPFKATLEQIASPTIPVLMITLVMHTN